MPMLTWLADVLRDAGLPVREVPGWQTRGHGAMAEIAGVLVHHTAGSAKGLYPSESIVVHGRPGLAGPLCNLGLDRAGAWIVVAAGQAWHAGTGVAPWCPAGQGNSRLIGVEAESVGTRDDWTPEQRESYPRGVAALLRHLGLGSYRVIGHKEWAPNRKIDPAFWGMGSFRADVARWMALPNPTPAPAPAPQPRALEDDAMYIKCQPDPAKPAWVAILTGPFFVGLGTQGEIASAETAIKAGALVQWVEPGTWMELDRRSHAVCDNPRPVLVTAPATPGGTS